METERFISIMQFFLPRLETGNKVIDRTFRIAVGDIISNINDSYIPLLDKKRAVIWAGLLYPRPWTRDSAINIWNGCSMMLPEVCKNTLLSVIEIRDKRTYIGGQYWDSIIWTIGSWYHYLYTADKDFLRIALEASGNSIRYLEETEFSDENNLFRGPAVFQDGISAYPDIYTKTADNPDGADFILAWREANKNMLHPKGMGIPMFALSTNCIYFEAYKTLTRMANELGIAPDPSWNEKANRLKQSINKYFWQDDIQRCIYLADKMSYCQSQEALGLSFYILFGIGNKRQCEKIFKNTETMPAGIPCLWPPFDRYKEHFIGRHCGGVWPFVQAFWANAAAVHNKAGIFEHEFKSLYKNAYRDGYFAEIYHPVTGNAFGGAQEGLTRKDFSIRNITSSGKRQTWSASGFLRMVFMGLFGINFVMDGLTFAPCIPNDIKSANLEICIRNKKINIKTTNLDSKKKRFVVNGKEFNEFHLKFVEMEDTNLIEIYL